MKIGFVGFGIVGSACGAGFKKLSHEILVHDINLNTKVEVLKNAEIIYICVPTPLGNSGECDISIVENCISELKEASIKGVICIKSTVVPGTTEKLSKKYGLDIAFVPEFLRERCAKHDFVNNHDLLAVGTENKDFQKKIINCHGHYPKAIRILSPTEAELIKYFSNVFNALKVVFANNFYEISEKLGADYSKIIDAYLQRDIGKADYLKVTNELRGYGGACLPKDTKALIALSKRLEIGLELIESIDKDNNKLKKTVFEGMRD
tara:strand:+ start:1821 stop:2612 length:792 start_codon:yes stop_codon:yes gene_type:complete